MPKATQQEEPDVIAYEQQLISPDVASRFDDNGCDLETEVWDGSKCVPKPPQSNND